MIVKFSGVDGTELWRIAGNAHAIDANGDFIVGASNGPLTVAKVSGTDGSEIWRVFIEVPSGRTGHALMDLTIDDVGNVLIAGGLQRPGNLSWDFAVVKFAGATGAELWRYVIKGSPDGTDFAAALAIDPSGNIIAGGGLGSERGRDFFVVKLSGDEGSEIWRRGVAGTDLGYDQVRDVAVDASGNVVAAGLLDNTDTAWDMAVLKLSGATGEELWRQEITGTDSRGLDLARVVAFGAAGDVLVGGRVWNAGRRAHQDFTVAKLSGSSGTRLWYREIRGTTDTGHGTVYDLIEDPAGDVIAVGKIQNLGANWDFAVVKLSGDDGSDLWRRDLNGTAHSSDGALAVAMDASGDVIVAGYTEEACTSNDFVVVKLNGSDGSGDLGIRDQCLNLVSGRRLQLRDPPGRPWKRRLAFISRDADFVTPTRGVPAGPTRDGGFLEILNPDTGQRAVYQLPAERWREIGERGDPRGWEYRDRWRQDGPCGKVIIRNKPRNRLKAICSGITFDFPLDEATQGGLAFRIVTGAEVTSTYCAAFGGRVVIDKPGRFFASGAPAPEGCPFP